MIRTKQLGLRRNPEGVLPVTERPEEPLGVGNRGQRERAAFYVLMGASLLWFSAAVCGAEIKVVSEHNGNEEATGAFRFKRVPAPARNDAATTARFVLVTGELDPNGGELKVLHDGKLPGEEDEPGANFFFKAGTDGGRLVVDLGAVVELKQVNSYSWHPQARGPQVYRLYGSAGQGGEFQVKPGKDTAPSQCGWELLARVDTRPQGRATGGQYGVSIFGSEGALGRYRYLLFDISRTEATDAFGNTFYSEIDVVAMNQAGEPEPAAERAGFLVVRTVDGACEITVDSAEAPELRDWAEQKLAPVLAEWYPKLTQMLGEEGYRAPGHFSIRIAPGRGVAATAGTRVSANASFLKAELERQAIGSLIHEAVHVVQQYPDGRNRPGFRRAPGWLVEGIADYIRWFKYEPQSHGADLAWLRQQRKLTLACDAGYRISANFLNWVFVHYDKSDDLLARVNAACRQGKYSDDLWKEWTGKALAELNDEWKGSVQKEMPPQ